MLGLVATSLRQSVGWDTALGGILGGAHRDPREHPSRTPVGRAGLDPCELGKGLEANRNEGLH